MACCGSAGKCSCILQEGTGISVIGSGTTTDPYIIEATLVDLNNFLTVADTATVNLTLTGSGTTENPLQLRAYSTMRLTDLLDVDDPGGSPSVGESPVWVGSGSTGHWEFLIPPPSPAGATNVANGLSGIGDVGDPVVIETSGVWGVGSLAGLGGDSTIGLPIYVDSAGDIRAKPAASTWAELTGKPTTFAPSAHTHPVSELTDLTTNGNSKRVNGILITSQANSVSMPSSPSVGDLVFFPEGT
jgi:hypothetical protein